MSIETNKLVNLEDAQVLYNDLRDRIEQCVSARSITESTSVISFDDGSTWAMEIETEIVPIQSGAGDPSPSNVRPITGWTGANIAVSPTQDAQDGTVYAVSFPVAAGTVYGGTLTVNADGTGTLTVTHDLIQIPVSSWNWNSTENIPSVATPAEYKKPQTPVSNLYKGIEPGTASYVAANPYCIAVTSAGAYINVNSQHTSLGDFQAYITANPLYILFERVTPIIYSLSVFQINSLLGKNNVWSNTGNITSLKYVKDDSVIADSVRGMVAAAKDETESQINAIIDDTAGTGDTDTTWSADKITSTFLPLSGGTLTSAVTMAGSDFYLGTTDASSDDSGDLVWLYGDGTEKMRIWSDDTNTAKHGPKFRLYNTSGTSLYSGRLPLADGTSATGTWGINISGTAATTTAADITSTTNALAYYSDTTGTLANAEYVTYLNHAAAAVAGNVDGLLIRGYTYGTAAELTSGVACQFSYGDAGPQIRFQDGDSQAGALLFTRYDDDTSMGATFNFLTNQSNGVAVKADGLVAKTRGAFGTNQINSNYTLYVNGKGRINDTLHIFPATSSHCEGIRIHSYNNWSEVLLCGPENTGDSGTSGNSWGVYNYNGNFYITRNGSSGTGTSVQLSCSNSVWKFNQGLTLYNESTTTDNAAAKLSFNVKDTTTNQVQDTAYIAAYNTHASDNNGMHLVLYSGTGIFIGGGESPSALYNLKKTNTGEHIYITADSTIYLEANANTIANRVGLAVGTDGAVIPVKAEAANSNLQTLGRSNLVWKGIYATEHYGSTYTIDNNCTLQWNSTDLSVDFVFA